MNEIHVNQKNRQNGTSLLETMIAVVVLSMGLIGIASTMLTSMRNNDQILLRTQSTMLANEIYEKIMANLPGAEAGNYSLSMFAALPKTTSLDCEANACTTAQMAGWDLAQWGARVDRVLPKADAAVSVNTSTDPMTIAVQIRYDELNEVSGMTTETFTFRAR